MEIPQGEVESENYGFQHTHLDEIFDNVTNPKQKSQKKHGELAARLRRGALFDKDQCLKVGKWSLLLLP